MPIIEIIPRSLQSAAHWRREHLLKLDQAQELYLENMVSTATCFEIQSDEKHVGYTLIKDSTIVEFHLAEEFRKFDAQILDAIMMTAGANCGLVKSFDHTFVQACSAKSWQKEIVASLYRTSNSCVISPPSLSSKVATEDDLDTIFAIHDQFFDSESEALSYLQEDARLFIYSNEDEPLGCGIIKKIVPCRNDYDIGFVVTPEQRRKRFASSIAAHLKDFCLAQGWHPVAGCALDNLASQRTLESAGFVCQHKLLRYSTV